MKGIKDILAVIVGLASALGAIYCFYLFGTIEESAGGHRYLWYAILLAVVAFICGLVYFLGHVNKEEEIHITQ